MEQQNFVSQQIKPVLYGNGHHLSPAKSFNFLVDHTDKSRSKVGRSANHQVPGELNSFPAPVNSTVDFISSVYGSQMFTPKSALYPENHAAATGPISNNEVHGNLPASKDISFSVSKNQYLKSSHKHPEQIRFSFGSPVGNNSSSGHRTASRLNPLNGVSQDFSFFSRKTSHS